MRVRSELEDGAPDGVQSGGVASGGVASGGVASEAVGSGGVVVDPVVEVAGVLAGLGRLNRWLDGVRPEAAEHGLLATVTEGLGSIDAVSAAAVVRAIDVTDRAGVAGQDGAASHTDWLAVVMKLSARAASRQARMAADLTGHPGVLAELTAGRISHDHALGLVAAANVQQADHDAAEAARRAEAEAARRQREAEALAAQAAAADAAERMRRAREAAERERQIVAEEREAADARATAAAQAQAERVDHLLAGAVAGDSPDQLRATARRLRATDAEALEREAAAQLTRRAARRRRSQLDGMAELVVRLTDADAELLDAALQATRTFDAGHSPVAERRTYEQRQYDAFIDLVRAGTDAGQLPVGRGVRPHLTVTVPADTLVGGDTPGEGQFGSLLSAETIRRIACDAGLTRAVLDATGLAIDIGRETRTWSAAAYKAAAIRFTGCAFPVADGRACGRPPGWCDLHHIRYWRNGGPTDQANGVPLCRHHHNEVHHRGWKLTLDHARGIVTITRDRDGQTTRRSVDFSTGRQADQPPPDRAPDEQLLRLPG